jgi:hypothetical protein
MACLRHLLVSLRRGPFAFEIGNLIRCQGDGDFTILKTMSEKRFSSLEEQELDQLIKALQEIGLCFAEGKLSLRTESDGRKSQ